MSQEAHAPNLADAELSVTKALPGSATTVYSDPIDLEKVGDLTTFLAQCELKISAPALTTAELPDAQTMTYLIQHDEAVGFGTVATLVSAALVQTGAGGAGAAAAVARFRLPSTVKRYIRVGVTKSGAGSAATASLAAALVF